MKIQKATEIERTKNWRIILYGKPGIGKTSAIKLLEGKTLVLDLDNSSKVLSGAENIDIVPFNRSKPEAEMIDFLTNVESVLSDYDNLVIDNMSSFYRDWFVERGRKSKGGIRNEIQDYGDFTNYFTRILTAIYSLPVNVLVTFWEEQYEFYSENGQKFDQYRPEIRPQVMNMMLGLTDIVARIQVNPKTHGRGVILEGNNSVYAKNRIDDRTIDKLENLFKFTEEK